MKKYIIALACMFSAMTGFAQDALTIKDAVIAPGETGQLEVILTNPETDYIACQFDFALPEGLDFLRNASTGAVSKKAVVLTDRTSEEEEEIEFTFSLTEQEGNNHFRFSMYHNPNHIFMGESGTAIVKFGVKASENFAGGQGEVFDIVITNADRVGFKPADATFNISVPAVPSPYYLVGTMNNWTPGIADYMLVRNTATEVEEYMITVNLTPGTQLKVATEDGQNWYPDGTGNAYGEVGGTEITAEGSYIVYFRPNGDGNDDWFYGFLYLQDNGTTGINTLTIDENAVIYNMKGQRVMNAQKGLYIVNGKKVVIK